jgi:hypothetical protein
MMGEVMIDRVQTPSFESIFSFCFLLCQELSLTYTYISFLMVILTMMLRHSPLEIHYAHHHQVSFCCNFTRIHPHLRSQCRPPTVRQGIFLTSKHRFVTNQFRTNAKVAKEDDEDADKGKGKENYGFPRKKLAVFVSGGGSNLLMIHKATMEGKIYGDISLVVSDKPGTYCFSFD